MYALQKGLAPRWAEAGSTGKLFVNETRVGMVLPARAGDSWGFEELLNHLPGDTGALSSTPPVSAFRVIAPRVCSSFLLLHLLISHVLWRLLLQVIKLSGGSLHFFVLHL